MPSAPDALLLIAPGCAYCPLALQSLADMIKTGRLGRLEVVNMVAHPQVARTVGARSVPWLRIGSFELEGAHTPSELAAWIEHAAQDTGWEQYFSLLFAQGRLPRAVELAQEDPMRLASLIALAGSMETPLAVRLGAGAVLEAFAGSAALRAHIPKLLALIQSAEPQVRADGCHYLALTNAAEVAEQVRPLLNDVDSDVREIAQETLEHLAGHEAP